ncbi:MAG: CapA family protein [Lachnospiraceae bacterium]|nr:CapA family protein [Lachnospiraceae bacterium]
MNRNARKRKNKIGTFFLTLSLVLLVGLAGIWAVLFVGGKEGGIFAGAGSASAGQEIKPVELLFPKDIVKEKIPEKAQIPSLKDGEGAPASEEDVAGGKPGSGTFAGTDSVAEKGRQTTFFLDTKKPRKITFCFAGDILFDDEYAVMASLIRRGGAIEEGISPELLEIMRGADVTIVNNEFPYTDRGTPVEGKTFTFRGDESTVSYLHDMGVDAVTLGNNHAYDFGEEGFLDTLRVLEENDVAYVGAGRNLREAAQPLFFEVEGLKVAVVAATQIERLNNPDTKGATETEAGVMRCFQPDKFCEAVTAAKEEADFVIALVHWGTENQVEKDWAQIEQAPKIAAAGADLIVGTHPHILQGVEYFWETPVVYSLGNFWFNSKEIDTGLLKVTIGETGILDLEFVPAIQKNCKTTLAQGEDRARIISYMDSISYEAGVGPDGKIYGE